MQCTRSSWKERKSKKRKLTKNVETKLEDTFKNKKNKTMIDFDKKESISIKSIALKGNLNSNVTSRFINGKMLKTRKNVAKIFCIQHDWCFLFSYCRS